MSSEFRRMKFHEDISERALQIRTKPRPVDKSTFKIFFYSRTVTAGVELDITDTDNFHSTDYSSSKKSVFVIHGWQNNYTTYMSQTVKNAYLSATDVNVFVVDWSSVAKLDYFSARFSVATLGKVLGEMIYTMVHKDLLNLGLTNIVGHSLGAHIAGNTGKELGGNVSYIAGCSSRT